MNKFYFVLLFSIFLTSCYKGKEADVIIHNAKIYTCDSAFQIVEAMAIKDGKIIDIGPNREILNRYSSDQIIDAQLRPIFPGFADAHAHMYTQALLDLQANLKNTTSKTEIVKLLKEKGPINGWIQGWGWDQSLWKDDDTLINNSFLNEVFPETPVFIKRTDGHAALFNDKALQLTGLDTIQTIEGGIIERDENGKCTGLILDNAISHAQLVIPNFTNDQIKNTLLKVQEKALALGLTQIHEAGVLSAIRKLFIEVTQNENWYLHTYLMLTPERENILYAKDSGIYETKNLTIRSFKIVADGALGSRGACLIEPYHDQHSHFGIMTTPLAEINDVCNLAHLLGYQVNTHCIGDSANQTILNTYADILKPDNDLRWRIEHAQVVLPEDISLFKKYNIIPSIQPTHATSDMRWAEKRFGKERLEHEGYRAKTFINEGNFIALGTDFPIESMNPLRTFYAAVARKNEEGYPSGGFLPSEKISRIEALMGMTYNVALASFRENKAGYLSVGKDASFVILSHDIIEIPEEKILTTNVLYTYIKGNKVYSYE